MLIPLALLLISAVVIYLSCELFVNGVEWVGRGLSVGRRSTATILAAFGAALPESAVTLVAVVFGQTAEQKSVGVGAALGGPLVLSTVAYGVVGLALLVNRQSLFKAGPQGAQFIHLRRDQRLFLLIFMAKIGLGLVAFTGKGWTSLLFLAAYGLYAWSEMRSTAEADPEDDEALEPLTFAPKAETPATWLALVQTGLALVLIFAGSHLFVHQLEPIGQGLGLSAALTALLLSPIATELPETLNAVIWIRQGKPGLALANISGSMMIQATIPTALGLAFTPWRLDSALLIAAAATAGAVAVMVAGFAFNRVNRGFLAAMSLFYLAFGAAVIWSHLH
jgi:cation:H+ antiporter